VTLAGGRGLAPAAAPIGEAADDLALELGTGSGARSRRLDGRRDSNACLTRATEHVENPRSDTNEATNPPEPALDIYRNVSEGHVIELIEVE